MGTLFDLSLFSYYFKWLSQIFCPLLLFSFISSKNIHRCCVSHPNKKVSPVSLQQFWHTRFTSSLFALSLDFRISPRWTSLQFFSFSFWPLFFPWPVSVLLRPRKEVPAQVTTYQPVYRPRTLTSRWGYGKYSTWGGAHSGQSSRLAAIHRVRARKKNNAWGQQFFFARANKSPPKPKQSARKDIDRRRRDGRRQLPARSSWRAWRAWPVPSICASCVRARICSFRLPHQMPVSREALRRQAFRLGQWWALFDPSLKKKEGFFPHASCTARTWTSSLFVRGLASNFSCSRNQESWKNAETNRRLGMAVTPAMGIRVILVSPSEDSFEKGNQSLDFPHFSTSVNTL